MQASTFGGTEEGSILIHIWIMLRTEPEQGLYHLDDYSLCLDRKLI